MKHPELNASRALRPAARVLVDQLIIHGADHVFCVPGESYLAVLDALYDARHQIRLVVNRHESGAAFMAEAYGKLTGRPGVCLVTRGPGATNAAVAIHTAFEDSTPLLVLVGQVGNEFADREAFQEIDYRRMFGQITKWVTQIDRAERIPEYLARAFQVASSGRSGPVVLALPEDMQGVSVATADAHRFHPVHAAPSHEQLIFLRAHLARASRPIVLLGGSGWDPAACANVETFVRANHLPVACVFRRQDLADNHCENYVGDVGIGVNPHLFERVSEADFVLALGTRLGEIATSGYTLLGVLAPGQILVHVHAHAEELGRVVQPSLAINAGVQQMASALSELSPVTDPPWRDGTQKARCDYERWQSEPPVFAERPAALNQWRVLRTLFAHLPADALVANGAGNFATWVHRFHRYQGLARGLRTQLAPTACTMGYGVPAGISAKILDPSRSVVIVTGDGDFLMTGQELATAVAERAAVLILVFNNGMYGTIRMHQERIYPHRVHGTTLHNPDFAALARAYGAFGQAVESTEAFEGALLAALAHIRTSGLPALLELRVDPEIITPSATLSSLRVQHEPGHTLDP